MSSQTFDNNNSIRITLVKFIIKINIIKIYTKNTHFYSPESPSKNSKSSSAYKAVQTFLIVLLATNQLGISFNAARESSTASSQFV